MTSNCNASSSWYLSVAKFVERFQKQMKEAFSAITCAARAMLAHEIRQKLFGNTAHRVLTSSSSEQNRFVRTVQWRCKNGRARDCMSGYAAQTITSMFRIRRWMLLGPSGIGPRSVDVEVDGEVGVSTIPQGSISDNCRC
jgi:hypothetical protein